MNRFWATWWTRGVFFLSLLFLPLLPLAFTPLQLEKVVFFLSETAVFHVIRKLKNALQGCDSFMS